MRHPGAVRRGRRGGFALGGRWGGRGGSTDSFTSKINNRSSEIDNQTVGWPEVEEGLNDD